ncbi:MAG: DUF2835 domain-containing protein [Gammaproteobacteria bacterium]|nr:DUF2835 domain-containing protein [Gammaproteobacteria bacterium]
MASGIRIRFRVALPADRYLSYYQGFASNVIVRSEDGRRIQLPAARLRPFLTKEGIFGRFELILSDLNKLVDIRRLSA